MHLNNLNSYILLIVSIKRFINEFFINTHLNNLINQKIMNILWNARASFNSIYFQDMHNEITTTLLFLFILNY